MPESLAAPGGVRPLGNTTIVRKIVDDNRILQALLRTLTSKRQLSPEDLDTLLDLTIQKVAEAIHSEAITVFLVEPDGKIRFKNVYYARSLYGQDEVMKKVFEKKAKELQAVTLSPGQGIVGKVISTGESSLVTDVSKAPDYNAKPGTDAGFRVRSMVTVPLVVDKRAIGALQAMNKKLIDTYPPFTLEDQKLLEEVANYSARVIQKTRQPDLQITDREMASYVARMTRHKFSPLEDDVAMDEKLLELVGEDTIRKFRMLPVKKVSSGSVLVAMSDPLDLQRKDTFQAQVRLAIDEVWVAADSDIMRVTDKFFKKVKLSGGLGDVGEAIKKEFGEVAGGVETVDVEAGADENSSPIMALVNRVIEDAFSRGASDIHIEPFEKEVLVRYRIDGVLKEMIKLPQITINSMVARIKIMAPPMKIDERRLPQDGRIKFKDYTKSGIDIDLRVSSAPLIWGEKICMRLLDKTGSLIPLDKMGFSKSNIVRYREILKAPYGMILHVGPTGSGKTTTLYAALQEINTPDVNIQTAEDPVEYQLRGVNQMQMNRDQGLTFAKALKCFLRQDPDIILVGEIRDQETAEIGIEAALTGHVLFSTLHTNDAAGTVIRFLDMGIEPFLVSSALLGVCAQRLLRRLCSKCKEAYVPSAEEVASMALKEVPPNMKLMRPRGCPACNGLGYKGRTGTHELMTLNDAIKDLINKRASSEIIREEAIKSAGLITLFDDTMWKVMEGVTSLEEGLAIVRKD
ncbi:MAG: GspE/PulE family protein [Planctomycetes bacterium]|nr:GspE/PulE family protein [Planctomycetota bacterium]